MPYPSINDSEIDLLKKITENTADIAAGGGAGSGGAPGAPINSPTFTGVPRAPTAAPGTNTTQLATTAFVLANGGGGGGGNVVGPASAVAGNIPTFSGTTGKVLADTGLVSLQSVSTSAGAADAGKLAVLNGLGQFDGSFIRLGLLRCIIGLGANQAGCVTATPTKVLIDTVIEDNSGGLMFDAANHRIRFIRDRAYQITALCRFGNISANGPRIISFVFKNGNAGTFLHQAEGSGLAGGNPGFAIPSPGFYVNGDFIELHGYQTTGANQLIVGDGTTGNSFLAVVEIPQ